MTCNVISFLGCAFGAMVHWIGATKLEPFWNYFELTRVCYGLIGFVQMFWIWLSDLGHGICLMECFVIWFNFGIC